MQLSSCAPAQRGGDGGGGGVTRSGLGRGGGALFGLETLVVVVFLRAAELLLGGVDMTPTNASECPARRSPRRTEQCEENRASLAHSPSRKAVEIPREKQLDGSALPPP